jgi:hypothetical protein
MINIKNLCLSILLIMILTACSPATRNITLDMLNSYAIACKDHGGIIVVYPENWIWTAQVICKNGTTFRFEGDKALSKTFRFVE